MEKKSKKLDQKIKEINQRFKELKDTQYSIVKKTLIGSLKTLCAEGFQIIQNENITAQNQRKRKQIQKFLAAVRQIEKDIQNQEEQNPSVTLNSRCFQTGVTQQSRKNQISQSSNNKMNKEQLRQKSLLVARSMASFELELQDIKYTNQQLNQAAKRLYNVKGIMEDINQMVIEQGGNVDKIQQDLKDSYEKIKDANKELTEAKDLQRKGRILKLRVGIAGLLGTIGMGLWGIPGVIFGFFGGLFVTK